MPEKKNKPVIHQFANDIFPRHLWVVKDVPFSWIKKRFKLIGGEELQEYKEAKAVTYPEVEHKKSCHYGILVVIVDSTDMSISDCAHEAVHFAMELCNAVDMYSAYENQELLAYLVGYATDAIYQVATNQFRPMLSGNYEIK